MAKAKANENKGESRGGVNNLIPYKKGQSGNPKGRPKGLLDFKTRLRIAIDRLAEGFVEQHNSKYPKKPITVEDVDIMGDIFAQYVNKARAGDQKAIDSLLDRAYGKATQPVEIGGIVGNPLADAQTKAAEAEIEAWQSQWDSMGVKRGDKKNADNTTDKRTKG